MDYTLIQLQLGEIKNRVKFNAGRILDAMAISEGDLHVKYYCEKMASMLEEYAEEIRNWTTPEKENKPETEVDLSDDINLEDRFLIT